MENFSLSIIIPTYKRNQKLKKIIYSITRQCPSSIKIEVIIISEINNGLQFFLNYPIKKKISNLGFLL